MPKPPLSSDGVPPPSRADAYLAIWRSAASVEQCINFVGHVFVVEGGGVGVVAERGGWVTVAQPGLGLEQLSLLDKMGGDTVAQTM